MACDGASVCVSVRTCCAGNLEREKRSISKSEKQFRGQKKGGRRCAADQKAANFPGLEVFTQFELFHRHFYIWQVSTSSSLPFPPPPPAEGNECH